MRVRDIQSHSPGPARPDLHIDAGPRYLHGPVHDLHVPDELGDVQCAEEPLDAVEEGRRRSLPGGTRVLHLPDKLP